MTPNIGAVASDIKRQITEDLYAQLCAKTAKPLPLAIEVPLEQLLLQQIILMITFPGLQHVLIVPGQPCCPLPPGLMVVLLPQHHEGRMILQPTGLIVAPVMKGSMSRRVLLRPAPSQAATEAARPLQG